MAITARAAEITWEGPAASGNTGELQQELRDLLCLAVAGDHIRWVLAGQGTAELARWLYEAAGQWRTWADLAAGTLVALGAAPDGRVRSLAKDVPLNWVPPGWLSRDEAWQLMTDRLTKLCEWAAYRRSQAAEPGTLRLLDTVCAGMQAQLARLAAITSEHPPSDPECRRSHRPHPPSQAIILGCPRYGPAPRSGPAPATSGLPRPGRGARRPAGPEAHA